MPRPRVRRCDGEELPLPTWKHFADPDPLTPRAVEQMVLGVSTLDGTSRAENGEFVVDY